MRMKVFLFCIFVLSWANQPVRCQARPEPPTWSRPGSPWRRVHNAEQASQMSLRPPSSPVPSTFFGMHVHNMSLPRAGKNGLEPWPTIPFGSWRLWDAHVAWPSLEPKKGEWHFEILDQDIALAQQHNVDVLLPLALSPTWASARPNEKSGYSPGNAAEPGNLDDWRNYVRTVATRYKGRVHNFEIWNEPNHPLFYTGDTQTLVNLTCEARTIIKEVSPDNLVVSPAATYGQKGVAWVEDFLEKGGGKCADVIGFHFYAATPEDMLPLIHGVRDAMARNGAGNKQLWDTEAAWPIVNHQNNANPAGAKALSDDAASGYIARAYLLQWASGVSRFFYYAWDNKSSGLTEPDGETAKKPASAYAAIHNWMDGAVMNSCAMDKDGTWVVELTHTTRGPAFIVWNPKGKATWHPPAGTRMQTAWDVASGTAPVAPERGIPVDITPKLIQYAR